MRYKNLTKEQILISLDRLTRFKNTKEKYLRVYTDILVSCLIEPKLKKNEIEKLDFSDIANYVSEIFNESLVALGILKEQNNINRYLALYENSIFNNDNETQKLLFNNINYAGALDLVSNDAPINVKWLKEINPILNYGYSNNDISDLLSQLRSEKMLKYPIEEVILVEGITEEILLPVFSKHLGYDFYSQGIQVIAAGGKNQVVKMYYKLAEELKIPIFVLLDKDAEENISQIKPKLREFDRIHLLSCGEFEDLLPKSLIIKTVNAHFENFLTISEKDLENDIPAAKILEEIFKTKGLHEFKKAEFAKLVRNNITDECDISDEIRDIIKEISLTNKMLDSEICS